MGLLHGFSRDLLESTVDHAGEEDGDDVGDDGDHDEDGCDELVAGTGALYGSHPHCSHGLGGVWLYSYTQAHSVLLFAKVEGTTEEGLALIHCNVVTINFYISTCGRISTIHCELTVLF